MSYPELKGQVVLVTGAASGMGKASALLFGQAGCKLALADRDEAGLKQTIKELGLGEDMVSMTVLDITEDAAVEAFVDTVTAKFGRLDIALNAAGVLGRVGTFHELEMKDFDFVVDINLRAQALLCRSQIRAFTSQSKSSDPFRPRGIIVNWASWIGMHGSATSPNYGLSKWGLIGLTRNLAVTYAKHDIRVNCVAPGFVLTPLMNDGQMDGVKSRISAIVPAQREGDPIEIARPVAFLASNSASYIHGIVLPVDGGWNAA